jgi:prevent-host-death family protein
MTVNMHEAKTNLSRLVESVENGTESRVYIARNGKPVACLVAVDPTPLGKRLGVARGQFTVPDSIDGENAAVRALFDEVD